MAANQELFSSFCITTFHTTMLLGNSFSQCENHRLCFSQPFLMLFKPALSQSITEMLERQTTNIPQSTRELYSPSYLALIQGSSSHIKAHALGLFGLRRCERSARGVGSAVASWLHSVVNHNGATSRPQRASTSRALPLFKNVFVLLFFLGTV